MNIITNIIPVSTSYSSFPTHVSNQTVIAIFRVASYLTYPICKSHEFFRRFHLVEELNSTSSALSKIAKKAFILTEMAVCGAIGLCAAPLGVLLYFLATRLEKRPFTHLQESSVKKAAATDSYTLLSWNICCIGGGYSISDGGVLPASFRIKNIVEQIARQDADIVCLFETFDSSFFLFDELKNRGYADFYLNMGPKILGVSSGMFLGSRYCIETPKFIPFPEESLHGRAKYTAKGVFAFATGDLQIYMTHLQHSEEPEVPIKEERIARKKELRLIMQLILDDLEETKNFLVTGDLNMDDDELDSFFAWLCNLNRFQNFKIVKNTFPPDQKTWRGDGYCASIVGRKKKSGPLNLDHTLIVQTPHSPTCCIKTHLLSDGFIGKKFQTNVLSDHKALKSIIKIYL